MRHEETVDLHGAIAVVLDRSDFDLSATHDRRLCLHADTKRKVGDTDGES